MDKSPLGNLMARAMEWPPDVEGKVFELIRPHAQCGLKRRAWTVIHDQLLSTVPRKGPWGHHRFLIQQNEVPPINADRSFQMVVWQDNPETSVFWDTMMNLNSIELLGNCLMTYFMNPPGDTNTDANIVATQANVSLEVATEAR